MFIGVDMTAKSFGAFLHSIRTRQKGTQLAKDVGISYVYLLDIEKGARPVPSNNVLLSLAEHLHFKGNEREVFFNLAAQEKGELPIDVAHFIGKNERLISIIREIAKGKHTDKCLEMFESYINNGNRGVDEQ